MLSPQPREGPAAGHGATSSSGSLDEREASELLQWAHQSKLTGALHFTNGSVGKSLYLDGGRIVASASTQPREQLGHFLVGRGLITEFELGKAIELQEETGLMIGAILVSIGSLTEAALRELLVRQCTEIVYDLLTWRTGLFRYEDRGSLPRGLVPAEIDIGPVLLSGVKRLEEWMRIRDKIPSLWAIPVSIQVLGGGVRDPLAARVLALVDDRRSVEEIWLESHTTEFALYSALAGAFERGELKFVVPSAGARVEPPVQPAFRMVSVVDLLDCAAIATDDGDQDLAERYLAAARSLAGEDVERARSACAHAEADESPWPEPEPESARPQGRDPIPMLARRPEEFIRIDLTPQQSFLLSRIDGRTGLGELLKICPIPAAEAEAAIAELVQAGHIRLYL